MLAIDDLEEMSGDPSFLATWLAPEEQRRLGSFKLPKRQKEWLAGRICAKIAVQKLSSPSPAASAASSNRVTVINGENGRPALFLDGTPCPGLDTSLSHSGEFALALIAEKYCGVDIQESRETLVKVQERFCSEADKSILAAAFSHGPGIAELNLLWTVKEAIRKTLSYKHIPDFLKIDLGRVEQLDSDSFAFHCVYQHRPITAICSHHQSYSIALCLSQG